MIALKFLTLRLATLGRRLPNKQPVAHRQLNGRLWHQGQQDCGWRHRERPSCAADRAQLIFVGRARCGTADHRPFPSTETLNLSLDQHAVKADLADSLAKFSLRRLQRRPGVGHLQTSELDGTDASLWPLAPGQMLRRKALPRRFGLEACRRHGYFRTSSQLLRQRSECRKSKLWT